MYFYENVYAYSNLMDESGETDKNELSEDFKKDLSEAFYECLNILESRNIIDRKLNKATSYKTRMFGEQLADLILDFIADLSIEEEEELFVENVPEKAIEIGNDNDPQSESQSNSG